MQHVIRALRKRSSFKIINILAYIGGLLGPVVTIPQLIEIWVGRNASGVSLLSWVAYLIGAVFWFAYGIIHKERLLVISYGLWIAIDTLLVLGIILYS